MAEQFRTRKVEKTYLALVSGVPEPREGIITAPLLRQDTGRTDEAKVVVDPKGQTAETSYRVLKVFTPLDEEKKGRLSPLIRGARGVTWDAEMMRERYEHIPYDTSLTEKARENRREGTNAENTLWFDILKVWELSRYKMTRQKPLLTYIVDIYCSALWIVIEVDGDSHAEQESYDNSRTKDLEKYGLKVLRYTNRDILSNTEWVYEEILKNIKTREQELHLKKHQTPHPPLSGGSYSLVELHPKTGRTHQIRVHMSHIGHPLIGDKRYGGPSVTRFPELAHLHNRRGHLLHAEKVEFMQPNREILVIQSRSSLS
jgi:very-short-patch-repair endonuclease